MLLMFMLFVGLIAFLLCAIIAYTLTRLRYVKTLAVISCAVILLGIAVFRDLTTITGPDRMPSILALYGVVVPAYTGGLMGWGMGAWRLHRLAKR